MKLVTFAGTMSPHNVGDTRLVPDDVAIRLQKEGAISESKTWPPVAAPPAPKKPERPVLKVERPQSGAAARTAR